MGAINVNAGTNIFGHPDAIPYLVKGKQAINTSGMSGAIRTCICRSHENDEIKHDGKYKAKLSHAAMLIDFILNKTIKIAKSDSYNLIYTEITANGETYHCTCDGKTVRCAEENFPANLLYLPYAVYAGVFEQETADYLADAVRRKDDGSALTFCDSFYYDFMVKSGMNVGDTFTCEDDLTEEEVKKMFSAGNLEDYGQKAFGLKKTSVKSTSTRKKSTATSEAAKKVKQIYEDCKAGKYLIAKEWDEEETAKIKPLAYLDNYVPTPAFFKTLQKMVYRLSNMIRYIDLGEINVDVIKMNFVNMLFFGDPGTGKTAMAYALSAALGLPVYEIKVNEDTEDDEFEGKNKIVKGQLSFVPTPFLKGVENGGIVLLEEANLLRANTGTSILNPVLEYPFMLQKNGFERIERNPLTVVIATMNPETEGTLEMNSAMSQRFQNKYEIKDASDEDFMNVLCGYGFKKENVAYIYTAYKNIRNHLKSSESTKKYLGEISIRQCIGALCDMEEGVAPKEAMEDTFVGAFAIKNKKLAENIKNAIIDSLPDLV